MKVRTFVAGNSSHFSIGRCILSFETPPTRRRAQEVAADLNKRRQWTRRTAIMAVGEIHKRIGGRAFIEVR